MNLSDLTILIRGAGEMASGVGLRLYRSGFRVAYTEIEAPLCVRRTVSFCEAIHHGRAVVEGATAELVPGADGVRQAWARGDMAVVIDPDLTMLTELKPDVLIDAVLAKRNLGLEKDMADLVIAMGPGFTAGVDADLVVETNRGHNLGRLFTEGQAEPNTGSPGDIAGQSIKRVLRAPCDGVVETELSIGDMVDAGQTVMTVAGQPVAAQLDGVLRGLIRPGTPVHSGLKIGDVDPRGKADYCLTVSDKARALGGSLLEAILGRYNR